MANEVERLVGEDRRITVNEISYELGISVGSVHEILTKKLKMEKKTARWVPHILSEEQKINRLVTCRNHLRRYRIEGEQFLSRVITGDETWARSYEPELKRQSAEWLPVDSPRPSKAIRGMPKMKSMHIIFYSSKKILVNYPVPQRTTVTGELYRWVLVHKLRPALLQKEPELLAAGPILLHDGAGPHRASVVIDQLDAWGWELLTHPPYSPDLSPCDYHLFPKMKEPIRGVRFETVDEITGAVLEQLKTLQKNGLDGGVPRLPHRWQSCVRRALGDYFEVKN